MDFSTDRQQRRGSQSSSTADSVPSKGSGCIVPGVVLRAKIMEWPGLVLSPGVSAAYPGGLGHLEKLKREIQPGTIRLSLCLTMLQAWMVAGRQRNSSKSQKLKKHKVWKLSSVHDNRQRIRERREVVGFRALLGWVFGDCSSCSTLTMCVNTAAHPTEASWTLPSLSCSCHNSL